MNNKFHTALHTAAIGSGVLTALFALLSRKGICLTLAITFGTVCYHTAMRLAVGAAGGLLPPGLEKKAWFRERSWEPGLYRALRVKRWKGKMPTYDPERFDLRRRSPEEVIQAACVAELTHEIIILLSFLPLLAIPRFGAAPAFAITSVLAGAVDGAFVVMQRYNRPRLWKLQKRRERQ